jgi:hypothetical protein
MEKENVATKISELQFNLGTFEGFNFKEQSAIDHILTADEVMAWDHDTAGEAEFWPSGDSPGVALVFEGKTSVTASELRELDRLLDELGGDSDENFWRIHCAQESHGKELDSLSGSDVEDQDSHFFIGTSFIDLRKEAAFELFELYYPEAYAVWEKCTCDGLIFDEDRFLDSPSFGTEELTFGGQKVLIVSPQ